MAFLRRLEIGCGVGTAILGIATAVNMISTDYEAMRRVERDFQLGRDLLVVSVLYVLPAVLVAIGSYLHASRLRTWELPMVIIASVWLVVILLLWLSSPFFGPRSFAWLNLFLAAMAIVTVLISLSVYFFDPQAQSNAVHQSNEKA